MYTSSFKPRTLSLYLRFNTLSLTKREVGEGRFVWIKIGLTLWNTEEPVYIYHGRYWFSKRRKRGGREAGRILWCWWADEVMRPLVPAETSLNSFVFLSNWILLLEHHMLLPRAHQTKTKSIEPGQPGRRELRTSLSWSLRETVIRLVI
jgi:hypothetical protein